MLALVAAMDDPTALLKGAAALVVAETILRDVVEAISPIPVMPLKGVLLQKTVYREAPEARCLSDVDVLVPSARYSAVHRLLLQRGYQTLPGHVGPVGGAYESPWRMHLDVHAALYDRFVFRVRSDDLFLRAAVDDSMFGVRVYLPDPHDLYAHLVGHFAKGRLTGQHPNLRDLPLTAAHFALDAENVARSLCGAGLGRAARYTLGLSVDLLQDDFAADVLRRLPEDRLGDWAAAMARRCIERPRIPWLAQVASAHMLNASLHRSAASFAYATGKWLRRRAEVKAASTADRG